MGPLLFATSAGSNILRARERAPLQSSPRARRPRTGPVRCCIRAQLPSMPAAGSPIVLNSTLRDTNEISTSVQRRKLRSLLLLAATTGAVLLTARPVLAAAATVAGGAGGLAGASALVEPTGFVAGLTASFALVLASEIGDKTFFISALLSMKYSRWLVLLGTMLALGAMTVISVGIGQLFHAVPTTLKLGFPVDDYAAIALLTWFGFQNIRDGVSMKVDESDELEGAKEVVAGSENEKSPVRVVSETGSLVFFAEWGDKSMLATVALAAAKSPFGVIVGGVSGHLVASIIAVVGGSFFGKYISEKNARLVGGVLFLVFAVLTLIGIY